MARATCWAMLFVAWLAVSAVGEEFRGVVRKVDGTERRLVLKIGEVEKLFTVAKDATIVSQGEGAKNKAAEITPIEGGLAGVKAGMTVDLRTEELDGAAVVTTLKVDATKPVMPRGEAKDGEAKKSEKTDPKKAATETPPAGKKKKKKVKKNDGPKKAKKTARRSKKSNQAGPRPGGHR